VHRVCTLAACSVIMEYADEKSNDVGFLDSGNDGIEF